MLACGLRLRRVNDIWRPVCFSDLRCIYRINAQLLLALVGELNCLLSLELVPLDHEVLDKLAAVASERRALQLLAHDQLLLFGRQVREVYVSNETDESVVELSVPIPRNDPVEAVLPELMLYQGPDHVVLELLLGSQGEALLGQELVDCLHALRVTRER